MSSKPTSIETFGETGLTSNMEDYMEAIAVLSFTKKVVRVKDIAKHLDIKMPSVSAALNKLKEMELIEYEKYGFIELTDKGKTIAEKVYRRHACLSEFFREVLLLDEYTADTEACRVEHTLSPNTCSQIDLFLNFFKSEEKQGSPWVSKLKKALK